MEIRGTELAGPLIITPKKFGDARGFFSETFKHAALVEAGVDLSWIQDNQSFSAERGVLRGLHFQSAPFAQAKIVRVLAGAVLDVAVDIRRGSPSYGRHVAVELSADNWRQLYVPVGFAHGFCTLTENVQVAYKVTAPYAPKLEGGLLWSDPALEIEWPVSAQDVVLSGRDEDWPTLNALQSPFTFED